MTEATRRWPTNTRMDGRVELICPEHGCGHTSKELTIMRRQADTSGRWKPGDSVWGDHDGVHGCCGCCTTREFREAEADHLVVWKKYGTPSGALPMEADVAIAKAMGTCPWEETLKRGTLHPDLERQALEAMAGGREGRAARYVAKTCLSLMDRLEALEEAAKKAGWVDFGWLPRR